MKASFYEKNFGKTKVIRVTSNGARESNAGVTVTFSTCELANNMETFVMYEDAMFSQKVKTRKDDKLAQKMADIISNEKLMLFSKDFFNEKHKQELKDYVSMLVER